MPVRLSEKVEMKVLTVSSKKIGWALTSFIFRQRDGTRRSPDRKSRSLPVLYKASVPEKAFLLRHLIFQKALMSLSKPSKARLFWSVVVSWSTSWLILVWLLPQMQCMSWSGLIRTILKRAEAATPLIVFASKSCWNASHSKRCCQRDFCIQWWLPQFFFFPLAYLVEELSFEIRWFRKKATFLMSSYTKFIAVQDA